MASMEATDPRDRRPALRSLPALIRYALACVLIVGVALFTVASSAPAEAEVLQTAECTVTWSAASDVCQNRKTNGPCSTRLQCQAETLAAAKEHCEKVTGAGGKSGAESCGPCQWATSSASSPCRKACEDQAKACEAECRKLPEDDKSRRQKCWKACNDAYASCIKKCKD
jgi:hypothetical protein